MTTLPLPTNTDWARMSWRAKRDWLAAADKVRRLLADEIQRELSREAERAAIARANREAARSDETSRVLAIASQMRAEIPDDPEGRKRLAALVPRVRVDRKTDEYRARNAARQRALRARRRQEAS